jgi:beta-galactosidase
VWDGERYVPAEGVTTGWVTASDAPTVIGFASLRGSRIRLTLTSRRPGEARGSARIGGLDVLAV